MICPRCNQNPATLQVTEVGEFHGPGDAANKVEEHCLCEVCAQHLGLPAAGPKGTSPLMKLLQMAAKKSLGTVTVSTKPLPTCQNCGLNLEELRRQGRVGCERCYESFREYLDDSLERLHGSVQHVGRLPGIPEGELERRHRVAGLKGELELAVRDEDYERAATLRDEIHALEIGPGGALA